MLTITQEEIDGSDVVLRDGSSGNYIDTPHGPVAISGMGTVEGNRAARRWLRSKLVKANRRK